MERLRQLVFLLDADSFGFEPSDVKLLRQAMEKGLSEFAQRAGVTIFGYGRKQNSIFAALMETPSYEWVHVALEWTKTWKIIKLENGCIAQKNLLDDIGYSWSAIADDQDSVSNWDEVVGWFDRRTTQEDNDFLSIPVGKTENGDTLRFKMGDTSGVFHGFVVGTNGTGKTSFLNQIILGIAENYTPNEVQLFLADLKQGVEFQYFAEHPNCKKILLGEDRKDDLLVLLREFSDQIQQRATMFRAEKVSNIVEYNVKNLHQTIPRIVLIIDEVQQLFSGAWAETNELSKVLELVVRQGRGFGVHVILSTQTLTGANVSKAIMSQIPLRVSFKLIGSEVYHFFDANNDAPTKLKKYHFVYNNEAGVKHANVIAKAMAPRSIPEVLSTARARIGLNQCLTPQIVTGQPQPHTNDSASGIAFNNNVAVSTDWNTENFKL